MSGIQPKISLKNIVVVYTLNRWIEWYVNYISKSCENITKQENKTYDKEKNQSIETNPELAQMLELADKDIKS